MKNVITLILLTYPLIINSLDAQIESNSSISLSSNPKTHPLSITVMSEVGQQLSAAKLEMSDANSKTHPLSIKAMSEVGLRIAATKLDISDNGFQEYKTPNVKRQTLNFELQTSNAFKLQTPSNFKLQTSNTFKPQTSNLELQTLNAFKPQTSNLELQTLKTFKLQTSNLKPQTSNAFKLQTSNFKLIDFFQASDTFNKQRFWGFVGAGATAYVSAVVLLDKVWYAQYPRSGFHLFDDSGEWQQMDKYGHVLTAYIETQWMYQAMRWTGMENDRAAWTGMATGTIFQATLEVLDGFSTEWGFSLSDMAANTAGCALFGVQQAVWDEQRIVLKVSNTPRSYSTAPIRSTDGSKTSSLRERTNNLYGQGYVQTFFKDYNALTWWLSINPKSFNKNSRFPSWLNVAVGYGADNMFGGYVNEWPTKKPEFSVATDLPRYKQFYLSLDVDLSKIKTKSKFLNTVFKAINFVKIPAPALEFNTLGQVKFHPLFF